MHEKPGCFYELSWETGKKLFQRRKKKLEFETGTDYNHIKF